MFRFLIRFVLFLSIFILVLELFFRTIIPATNQPLLVSTNEFGFNLTHFDTSAARRGVFTYGSKNEISAKWRINNDGWNAGIDYLGTNKRDNDAIVIVGDSYIEGFFVDWEDHFANRLQELTGGSTQVYALGVSGAQLSQFLLMTRYAVRKYSPKVVVILLPAGEKAGAGELKSSLREYEKRALTLQFERDGDGFKEVLPQAYQVNRMKRLVRKSALIRYTMLNRNVNFLNMGKADAGNDQAEVSGSSESGSSDVFQDLALNIIGSLKQEAGEAEIIFLFDADRNAIYNGEIPRLNEQNIMIKLACDSLDCMYLELNDTFYNDYQLNRKMFNFEINYHWNAYANRLAAEKLYRYFHENGTLP